MKLLRYWLPGLAASFFLLPLLLAPAAPTPRPQEAPKQDELTPADARAAIDAMYKKWSRGRVEYDKETLDSIMAPDFYVSLYGQKISREKFLSDILQKRPGSKLTRFDTDILTIRKTEQAWTVVISEKLEITISGADGETRKLCSLWVTRDGWRKDGDKWFVTFSEAIGHEYWKPGTKPPISDW